MALELTITNADRTATVTVKAALEESNHPIEFTNTAMVGVSDMDAPVSPDRPFLTYKAIESACISGMIYARRKLGLLGLKVELLSFSWTGKVDNAEPFAHAMLLSASKVLSKNSVVSTMETSGWQEATSYGAS